MPRSTTYTANEIAGAVGVSVRQLRAWERLVRPAAEASYTFRDLVAFRTLKALKDAGLSPHRIRDALHHLERSLPSVDAPLASLRLRVEGRDVVVDLGDRAMTACGQLLLELDDAGPRTSVVALPGVEGRVEKGRALARALAAAHTDLGEQLLRAGHAIDARRELERALLYDADHARAYQRLAEAFAALGCPVKAGAYRRTAVEKGWRES